MNLKYRGIAYQPKASNVTAIDKHLIGKYRGQDCYRAIHDKSLMTQPKPLLKYRGIAYGGTAQDTSISAKNASESTFKIEVPQHQKPVHSSRHQTLSELDRVHNDYLLKNLDLRISSARQKGDQSLVQMLEQEKSELA